MAQRASWSPTAQNFVLHQLHHVQNFWQQGKQAAFCLEALPGGFAELKVTFQLPQAGDIIPPPPSFLPASTRPPITPLFPRKTDHGSLPQSQSSSKKRKSYRRAVLHRAAHAAVSPPMPGSLRAACQKVVKAGCQQLPPANPLMSAADCSVGPSSLIGGTASESVSCKPSTSSVVKANNESATKMATCQNCEEKMSPAHQCELAPQTDPLPLCHYCCHRGNGKNPVHYYLQCICDESDCTCQCYCTEAQLEHKRQFYPGGFGSKVPVDPEDRPKAKDIAEARTEKLDGHMPCDNDLCVTFLLESNARATKQL